ncbi:MAG: hypothetical protein ABFD75_05585 [Smithella sp.]
MQAEVTFSECNVRTKAAALPKIARTINPIQRLQQFIGEGDWIERLPEYEKHISRFSWTIIIAAAVYLAPLCINIFIR